MTKKTKGPEDLVSVKVRRKYLDWIIEHKGDKRFTLGGFVEDAIAEKIQKDAKTK